MRRNWILAAGGAVALVMLLGAAFALATRTGSVQAAAAAIKSATVASVTGAAKVATAVAKTAEHSAAICEQVCEKGESGARAAGGDGAACLTSKVAFAAGSACSHFKAEGAVVAAGAGCSYAKQAAVPALVTKDGALTGRFDSSVTAACQGACAAKTEFSAENVVAQPGARAGQLTQCPVSGVVFKVRKNSARMALDDRTFYSCCKSCAGRLQAEPGRYLKV